MRTERGDGEVTGGAGFVKQMTIPSETVQNAECARRRVIGAAIAHRTRRTKLTEPRGKERRHRGPRASIRPLQIREVKIF